MRLPLLLWLLCCCWCDRPTRNDTGLHFVELVRRHGYPAEEHTTMSADGYRLRFHRIPAGPGSPGLRGKPVVYIQHGLFGSSDMFVVAGPGRDLAYILADAGYDVWLGNARGNVYSRAHVRLDPDRDSAFWEFSMHEIGVYDVSATLDYILAASGQPSLVYVGHSMGTTISLVLLSARPEFNDKIRLLVNLATVANWRNTRHVMELIHRNGHLLTPAINKAGVTELLPRRLATGEMSSSLCHRSSLLGRLCVNLLQYICGQDPDLLDSELLVEALHYFPAGASWRTLYHYYQNIVKGQLAMFDHGAVRNLARYGQFSPPRYNLSNVAVPVFMLYGKNDLVAAPEDSIELAGTLRLARSESVAHDKFNHLDFLWSRDVERLVHARVLEVVTGFTMHGRRLHEL